ncbi:MAG: transcription-repair coupling factor [Elusimicrobia bacterium]|nr:transcription-repair coupling factor [Elusimicrobiota bacterium]
MASPVIAGLPGPGAWAYAARCWLAQRSAGSWRPPALDGPLVLVVRGQNELEDLADSCLALSPLFAGLKNSEPVIAQFGEDSQARLASLELLRSGARLALCTAEALQAGYPSPQAFAAETLRVRVGGTIKRSLILEKLVQAGYRPVDFVQSPGEFAARGGVVDFFGLQPLKAVRLIFDEDTIASIRAIDTETQSTLDYVDEAQAVPASSEPPAQSCPLSAWLTGAPSWLFAEGIDPPEGLPGRLYRASEFPPAQPGASSFGAQSIPRFSQPAAAWEELRKLQQQGYRIALFSLNRGEDRRLQELLEERLPAGACQFLVGPFRQGFYHAELKSALLSTSEIFGRQYRPASRWKYFKGRGGLRVAELRQGDYVVHQAYGVSRYRGLKPVESPGHGVLDCLLLEFRGSDLLYVPMHEFGLIQKYSGAEGKRPRLSSLDTRKWEEIKRSVQEGVRELAEQLLKVAAARQSTPGHAFPPQSSMEREFAEAFPYEETPDQAAAIEDVLADMMAPHPMDRLVIGDVGFGKTEVAMRAAFKCVSGYKQAAVLVPTTILADQHYRTFTARFADYPVKIGLLTRFQTPAEQKRTLKALAEGGLDVVIGTSRLLQKDVAFKDLGLVVIDEEHRFGVKDKEKLKQLRRNVDYLALSATPIPRSLNQSMSGLRGLSLIQSAPTGRQPIVTKVGPWDEGAIAAAIQEELSRGGQAYYVHNRVRTLEDCRKRLAELVPSARFGLVHGQMKGPEIEQVMWDFFNRRFDVLVSTTIIESGMDNPAVNTLIVEDAHEFGLAQLYQLRGRIGRERQRAVCYFFYPENYSDLSALSEEARKRLEALKEFAQLGAGLRLALRDLEIRGAGELLGARQHGFINAVGVDYYTQLLREAIGGRQGRSAPPPEAAVQIDLKLPAFIPQEYLPGEMERLDFYKRILRSAPAEAEGLRKQLEDLCGPAPRPVENLFALLKIRQMARAVNARSIVQKGQSLEIFFRRGAPIDPKVLSRWLELYRDRIEFIRSEDGDGLSIKMGGEEALNWLEDFLLELASRSAAGA